MAAFTGKDGRQIWKQTGVEYFGPCIIHGKTILTVPKFYDVSAGAFSLMDGSPVLAPNPLTGKNEPWSISRGYGCNSVRASEHLLTYRSDSAAYYDLSTKTGTGTLGGFRSGCASNLIIANGVLNAPEFTRHCICNFQNQTSLALVHMPGIGMESWTCHYGPLNPMDFSDFEPKKITEKVNRLGINFGAPGDRMSADGTLWLDYPDVGGSSFSVPLEVKGGVNPIRRHEASIKGALPWVSASGMAINGSIALDLNPANEDQKARPFTVRLYFAELETVQPGERVFDVSLQGKKVFTLDIAEAVGRDAGIVKAFAAIPVERRLNISLKSKGGKLPPVICGIEVVAE
jgi:hypothetical protein